ncbi:uroporphyrinogen decarboxylase [Streptohalobacillus salinus]|uniref:Uroporphyrinogen decarboxylase n=1 Tax=Streptohalobacillus salinus TaxID=621096 RepID=A0A2V3W5M9_9BACI|nr:uroporphyrinogen decarboxylase family protein [Streptohalobacillus salinus]PXW88494.1 uroporphyrinogen decarboxylase [Streptohalobacillus salinus]
MTNWNKKARFDALLNGKQADRPIVSGWHHFLDQEQTAADLAEATIAFANKFDWDWIKINPRATYLAEAFGNRYDFTDYQWVFPRQTHAVITDVKDVWKIDQVEIKESAALQEQILAVKTIREGLPDTPIIQTLFSPLTILLFLTGNSSYVNQSMYGSDEPLSIERLFNEERAGVHQALHNIAYTMADYVRALEQAGVDGIFYAVTGTAHPELFDEAAFNEFSRPYDLIVLHAMEKGQRLLHTCGAKAQPERFDDYPVEGISWDPEAEGNPGLDISLVKTKVAGVNHNIFAETDVAPIQAEIQEALSIMKEQPFLLVPNCAVSVNATDEALRTLRDAVK